MKEYCSAEDGSWQIYLCERAYCKGGSWVDGFYVSVRLPQNVPHPWEDNEPLSVGVSFNTYADAWAHVNRQDLTEWALTQHIIELTCAVFMYRRRARDVDPDGKKFRALEFLEDIRCAILDTGWPLGDDSDPELTPVRLVKEILAENAKMRERSTNQRHLIYGTQDKSDLVEFYVPEGESAYINVHLQQTALVRSLVYPNKKESE